MNDYKEDLNEYNKGWETLQKSWSKKKFAKLYHISKVNSRNQILSEGIIPKSLNGPVIFYSNRVFLTTNDSKLHEIQELTGKHTCPMDLWEIDNSKLNLNVHLDEFAKNERCCYVTEKIAPEYIKLVKTIEPYFEE